jgi:hypothetical protein
MDAAAQRTMCRHLTGQGDMDMTRLFPAILALCLIPAAAGAQDLAAGADITAAIAGNTVQGSMSASGAYTEFYAADGAIKGQGYSGTWTVEGDAMCFDYGEGKDCWGVRIDGDAVTWVQNGADGGTGTIVSGNPNNF